MYSIGYKGSIPLLAIVVLKSVRDAFFLFGAAPQVQAKVVTPFSSERIPNPLPQYENVQTVALLERERLPIEGRY